MLNKRFGARVSTHPLSAGTSLVRIPMPWALGV